METQGWRRNDVLRRCFVSSTAISLLEIYLLTELPALPLSVSYVLGLLLSSVPIALILRGISLTSASGPSWRSMSALFVFACLLSASYLFACSPSSKEQQSGMGGAQDAIDRRISERAAFPWGTVPDHRWIDQCLIPMSDPTGSPFKDHIQLNMEIPMRFNLYQYMINKAPSQMPDQIFHDEA